ncbi:MAG: hypothetical protein UMS36scaffold28_3 [Phage 59_13]|nr:MAG: hypothetical protein UMS36scaffold28_3 [Phage 59_13]
MAKSKGFSPHSGTIRISWAQCPNRECPSRDWDYWEVDFVEDAFSCGTCELSLERPLFFPNVAGNWRDILCKDCHKIACPTRIVKPSGEVP